MDLSVIIVNWNVRELLKRCLRSIYDSTRGISFEVFVIDNASSDKSVEMVSLEFPHATIIANEKNLGFARANNLAIEQCRGDLVLLLNPDTSVRGNALGEVVAFARRHPEAGVIGCKFLNPDGTHQPSVRRFPRLIDHAMMLLKLHHLFPNAQPLRRYLAVDIDPTRTQEVDQVSGTFMCISRAALNTIGFLDERFFIWYEDVDYCKRVKKSGMKVLYEPSISIVNQGGKSFAQVVALKKQRMMNKSMAQYFRKHHSIGAWLLVEALRPLSIALTWLIDLIVYRNRPTEGVGSKKLKIS